MGHPVFVTLAILALNPFVGFVQGTAQPGYYGPTLTCEVEVHGVSDVPLPCEGAYAP
jgi:hypothetical protein